jgi:DNA recombination-dependent growth factor C
VTYYSKCLIAANVAIKKRKEKKRKKVKKKKRRGRKKESKETKDLVFLKVLIRTFPDQSHVSLNSLDRENG